MSAARAGPAAELDRVGAIRGGRAVLTDLSLVIRPGRLLVVQGRSGSGKTTLLRLLTGLEPPDSGAVRVAGTDLAGLDRAGLARLRREHLAVAGQSGSLVEALDVRANLELVRDARGLPVHSDSDGDSDGGLPDGGLPDGGLPDGVDGWVESMGLTPLRHRPVRLLSGGERQRVVVARVLVTEAPLAVLDEPTSAQDEAGAERLVAVLVAAAARGIAVVVATHDPILVAAADDVVTLG